MADSTVTSATAPTTVVTPTAQQTVTPPAKETKDSTQSVGTPPLPVEQGKKLNMYA